MLTLGDPAPLLITAPHYLNHASIGAMTTSTVEAMHGAIDAIARGGVAAFQQLMPQLDATRRSFGRLIGAPGEDVALVAHTDLALTAVALCHPWTPGDRIVLVQGEFPANITPWQRAAELHGLEIVWIPAASFYGPGGDGLAQLDTVLRAGAAMVAVSLVQFQTGLRMPVEAMTALAHRHGAAITVDAIQGCGAVPFEAGDIDYIASGGQKWLNGPPGAGLLYARHDRWEALEPHLAGWLSHHDPLSFLMGGTDLMRYDKPFQVGPAKVEGGTPNLIAHAALAVAIDDLVELTPAAVHGHVQPLLDELEAGLVERGFTSERSPVPEQRSCILSLIVPAATDLAALVAGLGARGVSAATPDGRLRLSPHWHNRTSQAGPVLAAINAVMADARP